MAVKPIPDGYNTVTPYLTIEHPEAVMDFLTKAFDGKEVYGFSPNTVTVVEGDTIHFTFINPEDDVHSFVLPDLGILLKHG